MVCTAHSLLIAVWPAVLAIGASKLDPCGSPIFLWIFSCWLFFKLWKITTKHSIELPYCDFKTFAIFPFIQKSTLHPNDGLNTIEIGFYLNLNLIVSYHSNENVITSSGVIASNYIFDYIGRIARFIKCLSFLFDLISRQSL